MAKQGLVNRAPANGAEAIFDLIAALVLAGWAVQEESDGTTYEADVPTNGRQITVPGSGAGGMDNSLAWIRIADPSGAREWTFQRESGASDPNTWRAKYSALDTFNGGTPGVTQTPGATDEQVLIGAGTDAAPTMALLFNAAGAIGRWHCIALDVANSRSVYPFWAFATNPGGSVVDTLMMCEAMDPTTIPALVGTRAAPITGDPDPCVVAVGYASGGGRLIATANAGWCSTTPPASGWHAMNGTNSEVEAWVPFSGFRLAATSTATGAPAVGTTGFGVSPYDSADEGLPLAIGRAGALYTTQLGFKGHCENMRLSGVERQYPSTLNLATDAYIYAEDMLIPWLDGVVPLT